MTDSLDTLIELTDRLAKLRTEPEPREAKKLIGWIAGDGISSLRPGLVEFLEQVAATRTSPTLRTGSVRTPVLSQPVAPTKVKVEFDQAAFPYFEGYEDFINEVPTVGALRDFAAGFVQVPKTDIRVSVGGVYPSLDADVAQLYSEHKAPFVVHFTGKGYKPPRRLKVNYGTTNLGFSFYEKEYPTVGDLTHAAARNMGAKPENVQMSIDNRALSDDESVTDAYDATGALGTPFIATYVAPVAS
ncbi:Hypothetical protein POVN_LOCUS518 [uncultured virus]|nr:Hypothetical protein POVN_LOCUS518 [uncultured virus]